MTGTPKTPAQRKEAERERRKREGLKRLEVYAHPEDHPPIKQYAEKLRKKRGKRIGDQAVRDAIDAAPEPQEPSKE